MATDTLTVALWECTVDGCDYTTDVPFAEAQAVTHNPRGVNRAPHRMRLVPSGSDHAAPDGTTVARHP